MKRYLLILPVTVLMLLGVVFGTMATGVMNADFKAPLPVVAPVTDPPETTGPEETGSDTTAPVTTLPETTEPITETEPVTETETWTETETETEPPETEVPFDNGCNHKLKTVILSEPTCYAMGVTQTYCDKCGYKHNEYQTKLKHKQNLCILPDGEGHYIQAIKCATCGYIDEGSEVTYKLHFGEEIGLTREKVVDWLTLHENDEYYIGTPYQGYAYAFPRGAANYSELSRAERAKAVEAAAMVVPANVSRVYPHSYGIPGMNCAGLVGHIMFSACGGRDENGNSIFLDYFDALANNTEYIGFSLSSKMTRWSATNAYVWYEIIARNGKPTAQSMDNIGDYICYKFPSKKDMLSSGVLKKGDIIMCIPQYSGEDKHLGVYWGSKGTDDKFWVSELYGVQIQTMYAHEGGGRAYFYVLPLKEENPENWVSHLKKTPWEIVNK